MERVDVAVVGLGVMGAMALWRAAQRGVSAAGLDRFTPPHDRGSSHGESRIIRTAYAEGAFYVPLLLDTWELWRELERRSDSSLLLETGGLMIGRADQYLVGGAVTAARQHGLPHEVLDAEAAGRRWPQHRLQRDDTVLFEPRAGVLRPEQAVAAALTSARELGATVRENTTVAAIDASDESVRLHLASGEELHARRCIVAAGAWTAGLVPALAPSLRVERQVMAWLPVDDPALFSPGRFPVFIRELADGRLRYGIPSLDGKTIKVAVHHEGRAADPDTLDTTVTAGDVDPVRRMATEELRGVRPEVARATVCMYTNTPDQHFILGPLDSASVVVLGGCSGHSFKFAPVLADTAIELALDGAASRDVAPLQPSRLLAAT